MQILEKKKKKKKEKKRKKERKKKKKGLEIYDSDISCIIISTDNLR